MSLLKDNTIVSTIASKLLSCPSLKKIVFLLYDSNDDTEEGCISHIPHALARPFMNHLFDETAPFYKHLGRKFVLEAQVPIQMLHSEDELETEWIQEQLSWRRLLVLTVNPHSRRTAWDDGEDGRMVGPRVDDRLPLQGPLGDHHNWKWWVSERARRQTERERRIEAGEETESESESENGIVIEDESESEEGIEIEEEDGGGSENGDESEAGSETGSDDVEAGDQGKNFLHN